MSKCLYYAFNLLCLYLIISRALTMPIQGDEAGTYLRHAITGFDGLFNLGTANNHFLNTLFIKLTTAKAPFSEEAIRLPVLLTYAWFFLYYVPTKFCLPSWTYKLLFAIISLFPYYISEYASMARGYILSSCFMCAALNELALFSSTAFNASNSTPDQYPSSEMPRILRVCMFSSLATLSSILVFPLFIIINLYGFLYSIRSSPAKIGWSKFLRFYAAIALFVGTSILTVYTFLAIKVSGVATISSPPVAFDSWFVDLPMLLHSPIFSVANAIGSSSPLFAQLVFYTSTASIIAALAFKCNRKNLRVPILLLYLSFFIIYLLALIGSYPTGRGWLPFWFSIVFSNVAALNLIASRLPLNSQKWKCLRWPLLSMLTALTLVTAFSLWHSYTGNYVYELRPFYYQYKSLMHYSRVQNLKCLSYGDINDEVLKFYYLNDAGPVPSPEECPPGAKSQRGFMQYSLENKEPFFE